MDDSKMIPGDPENGSLEEQISKSLLDGMSDETIAPDPDNAEDVLSALDDVAGELPQIVLEPFGNETADAAEDPSSENSPCDDAQIRLPEVEDAQQEKLPREDESAQQEKSSREPEKPARPSKAGCLAKGVFFTFTALCLAFGIGSLAVRFACENRLLSQDTFYRVSVGGTDLTGMTQDEAEAALDEAFSEEKLDRDITFCDGTKTYREKISRFNPQYDVSSVLEEAWNFGHTGTRREKLRDIYTALSVQHGFSVPCEIAKDEAVKYAAELAGEIDCEMQEPSITVNPENDGINNLFLTQQEQVGRKLNQDALVDAIVTAHENDFAPIELTVTETQPTQTLAQLQENVQPIRTFTTQYSYISSRVFNIHRATDAINGTVLQPGEEFSFNAVVGNTSLAENGYREAGVIVGGRSATGRGGGVCQAATTLYNVAVRCDMEITQRAPHAIASTYVPKGQDATIAYGYYDMAFRNTSDYPIYIFGSYTDTSVTFTIYGKPLEDGVTIEMESEMLGTRSPGEAKVTVDYSKPVGYRETVVSALNGYDVRVYKIRYDKNGNEIERVVDHEDAYPTRRAEITVGGAQPAPVVTAAPESSGKGNET